MEAAPLAPSSLREPPGWRRYNDGGTASVSLARACDEHRSCQGGGATACCPTSCRYRVGGIQRWWVSVHLQQEAYALVLPLMTMTNGHQGQNVPALKTFREEDARAFAQKFQEIKARAIE